ncbi:hypothetical protein [Flavobacterium sp.]|uniref:hypothetical protein n=1 Tax=Flavobacterium sp. TaxID=239 RepID=UPI0024879962|nr:hypothetical protein [Flavobacterium sp.]MDI1318556.1 hypothetical protein [Flavobacterium sp.]
MEILEVSPQIFDATFPKPSHVFNTGKFNELNASRFEVVYYLLFKDSKTRLGIAFGLKDNVLLSPFSAPYGGFENVSSDIKLYQIDAALEALSQWAENKGIVGIRILPPSTFYTPDFSAKMTNCLYRAGFTTQNIELNYYFQTDNFSDSYSQTIWYNAKKNLNKSLSYGLTFEKLAAENGSVAHAIIGQNRSERGFPMRLTWEQLETTSVVIPVDYFLVKDADTPIASAIIYHVAPSIVRVVYWGDLPKYSDFKTMNFLSYNVFKYYKEQGIKTIDIGHSTVDSIPNNGLCEFKEGIGCSIDLLTEYYKSLV